MPAINLPVIAYEELDGSPKESLTGESFQATRQIKCAWGDRLTLMRQFVGGIVNVGVLDVYYNTATYPHFSPAVCISASCEPFGATQQGTVIETKYAYAKITLQYETPSYDNQDNTAGQTMRAYRTENLVPSAKMISLTSESLYWSDSTELANVSAPQKIMLQLAWNVTLHEVPNASFPAETFTLIGKTNNATEHSDEFNRDFPAGTLLFQPPVPRPTRQADGTHAWEIEYNFLYQPEGWNKFYNPNTQAFESIYKAVGGGAGDIVTPYPEADFTPITEYKP